MLRNKKGQIPDWMLRILFGVERDPDAAAALRHALGLTWRIGPGRRTNGPRNDREAAGCTFRQVAVPKLPKFRGQRPGYSYRAARRNIEWVRKPIGNSKPAERRAMMGEAA